MQTLKLERKAFSSHDTRESEELEIVIKARSVPSVAHAQLVLLKTNIVRRRHSHVQFARLKARCV